MPKISQLTTTTALSDTDTIMVLQSGINKKSTVKTIRGSIAQAFTALSSTAWDASTESNKRTKTLTSNTAITISNAPTSFAGLLEVTQDATGSRTLTINGTSVTVNNSAGATTMIGILNVGGTLKFYAEGSSAGSGAPDTTAPTVQSINATAATNIRIVFSEAMSSVTVTGWTFNNGSSITPSAVSQVNSSIYDFTVSGLNSGQTITASYDAATGNTTDSASNELATFSGASVVNELSTVSLTLNASTTSDITSTSNRFTTTGYSSFWNHKALDPLSLLASQNGYIQCAFVSMADVLAIFGFHPAYTPLPNYNAIKYAFYIESGGELKYVDNGSIGSTGITLVPGLSTLVRIKGANRSTTPVFTLEYSSNGGASWTLAHTYGGTDTGQVWIHANIYGGTNAATSGYLNLPKGFNVNP